MITNVHIENFKSIENMDLPLGSLNILIGENGCGKTNILEAAAIGVAAAKDKLDNEYYFARGIRKTENRFMKSAFAEEKAKEPIIINFAIDANEKVDFKINENAKGRLEDLYKINDDFDLNIEAAEMIELKKLLQKQMLLLQRQTLLFQIGKTNYLLYAPENTFLRKFEEEGQIEGLGIRGEGLFDTLQKIYFLALAHNSENYDKRIAALDKYLSELESVIGRTYKKNGKIRRIRYRGRTEENKKTTNYVCRIRRTT